MQSKYVNLQRANKFKITDTNLTVPIEFVLLGFSDIPQLHWFLFGIFLFIYMIILLGNGIIILITKVEPTLQTPMYFFISNFSFLEICYVSVTLPRMLMDLFTLKGNISFLACATQMCLFLILGATECFLLAVMSYDRYAAICFPLHYEAIMNKEACVQMVAAAWLSGCVYGSVHATGTFSVHFCGPNVVYQFFCDIPSLLRLACFGDQILEYVFIITSCCFAFMCFILMVISYVHIFTIILRIPSIQGRFKIFSTCIPHLTVVTLFLSSGFVAYLGSAVKSPSSLNLFMSVFYSLLPPSLNPVIYSFRNSDVKVALNNIFGEKMTTRF